MVYYLAFIYYFSIVLSTNGQFSENLSPEANPYYDQAQRSPASKENSLRNHNNQKRTLQQQTSTSSNENNLLDICSLCDGLDVKDSFAFPTSISQLGYPENIKTCGDLDNVIPDWGIRYDSKQCADLRSTFFSSCCEPSIPIYECTRRIRKSIVDGQDTVNPPLTSDGLNITVDLRYEAVTNIDVQEGIAEIFVSLKLHWVDPRLAWTVNADNCASQIHTRASLDAELTEIWVPNYDLANRATSVSEMPESSALVFSSGYVLWERKGPLKILCQFTGLASIPYDTLGCQMFLSPEGSQSVLLSQFEANTNYIQGNLTFGPFTPYYNEYTLVEDRCTFGQGYGPTRATMYYDFYFSRAKGFYESNIVIPTIILTYLSFFAFFLDLRIGERISYGVALTLVVVAQQIITADRVPISQRNLWMGKLVAWSFYWNVFVVVESVILVFIYFLREDAGKSGEEKTKRKNAEDTEKIKEIEEIEECNVDNQEIEECNVDNHHKENKNSGVELKEMKRESSFEKIFKAKTTRIKDFILSYPIRSFDFICAFLSFLSYSIFLICMYATRSQWVDEENPFLYPSYADQLANGEL